MDRLGRVLPGAELPEAHIWEKQKKKKKVYINNLNFELAFWVMVPHLHPFE